MKLYVGNGYYYVGLSGRFNINIKSKSMKKKKCLNNGRCIVDKEHLKRLFTEILKKDLTENNIDRFFCVTHDSFIDLIEHTDFEVKIKVKFPMTGKANIKELFKQWECNECSSCEHKEACFVCNGNLPDIGRDNYFLVFKRKKNK